MDSPTKDLLNKAVLLHSGYPRNNVQAASAVHRILLNRLRQATGELQAVQEGIETAEHSLRNYQNTMGRLSSEIREIMAAVPPWDENEVYEAGITAVVA